MKNSFLYGAYRTAAKRFGLLIILLLMLYGTVISYSSKLYLQRFETMSQAYYEKNFQILTNRMEAMLPCWHGNKTLHQLYQSGAFDQLNEYFTMQVESFDATNPYILLSDSGHDTYAYQEKILSSKIIDLVNAHHGNTRQPLYSWIDNKLWLVHAKIENDYKMIFAVPINSGGLAFVDNWGYGDMIEQAQVCTNLEFQPRSLTNWNHLTLSYAIDKNASAYLVVNYRVNTLYDYFYKSYAIVFGMTLLIFMLFMRYALKTSYHSAGKHLERLEAQVSLIASGDYSKKLESSGFIEFYMLESEINQMSTAIQKRNAQLKKNVRELYDLLIEVLEQKDPYTRGHSERVASFSLQIAKALSLSNLEEIYSAALLHDIGKIAIPESVLRKTGSLTKEEYDDIKTHPQRGFNLLLKSSQFEGILDGVLYHHERLDGSGYPCGLKGDQIPMQARIIAVADVYDALTSDRSYRPAMTIQEATAIIEAGRGTKFDAAVVDCLLTCIKLAS